MKKKTIVRWIHRHCKSNFYCPCIHILRKTRCFGPQEQWYVWTVFDDSWSTVRKLSVNTVYQHHLLECNSPYVTSELFSHCACKFEPSNFRIPQPIYANDLACWFPGTPVSTVCSNELFTLTLNKVPVF